MIYIGCAKLDAFFLLVPLSLRSARRRRVAPNLNQKVENATLKNYSAVGLRSGVAFGLHSVRYATGSLYFRK